MHVYLRRVCVLAISMGVLASAQASLTYQFLNVVSGDIPDGSNWATLVISDLGADEVEMTLTHNVTSEEPQFISELWLNLTDIPDDLAANFSSPISSISWGEDAFPNTGNRWDVDVNLFTSQGNRLEVGDSVTWTMTGTGLDEGDFIALSTPSGQNMAALGMIHLQSIGTTGGSAKITVDENFSQVPEPTSLAVISIGALALWRGRKSRPL